MEPKKNKNSNEETINKNLDA